jgi:hypothetical protein
MGMFWDGGGHIALEEVLAVGTTMLTMNRYLNPDLWDNNQRWTQVDQPSYTAADAERYLASLGLHANREEKGHGGQADAGARSAATTGWW